MNLNIGSGNIYSAPQEPKDGNGLKIAAYTIVTLATLWALAHGIHVPEGFIHDALQALSPDK